LKTILTGVIGCPLQTSDSGEQVTDEWSITAKNMLLQFAGKIQLPDR